MAYNGPLPQVVKAGGTGASTFTTHSLLLGQGTSAVTALGAATNGQIPVGSTGSDPVLATLTAGTGISISNGAGSITVSSSGAGMAWNVVSSNTQSMSVNNGYVVNNGATLVTFTLPSTASVGDTVVVMGSSSGGWTIQENSGQSIRIGSVVSTTSSGAASSTNQYDSIRLVCITANTTWSASSCIGNISLT